MNIVRAGLPATVAAALALLALVLAGQHRLALVGTLIVCAALIVALLLTYPQPKCITAFAVLLAVTPDLISVGSISGFTVTARMVVVALFGLATIIAAVRGEVRLHLPFGTIWLVLFVIVIIGCYTVTGKLSGIEQFAAFVFLPFLCSATLVGKPGARDAFVRGIAIGAAILLAVALLELLRGHDFLVPPADSFERLGTQRVDAGWSYPKAFGSFFSLTLFVVASRPGKLRLPLLILMVVGIFFAQDRAGLIGVAATLVFAGLVQRRVRDALAAGVALLGFAAVVLFVPGGIANDFRQVLASSFTAGSEANGNIAYREQIFTLAAHALKYHPYFGYGFGADERLAQPPLSSLFAGNTDLASLPIALAIDLGYTGLVCFLLFWLMAIVRALRASRTYNEQRYGALALIAGLFMSIGVVGLSTLMWMMIVAGLVSGDSRAPVTRLVRPRLVRWRQESARLERHVLPANAV